MAARFPLRRFDLDIAPREVGGETVYIVADPETNEWHELDDLQYEVLMMLDGKTSVAEVTHTLVDQYDVEVDVDELDEFIDGLRELNLLDVATDLRISQEDEVELAQRVKRQIAIDGVVFARRSRSKERRVGRRRRKERRRRHLEAALIDAALHHLEQGRVQKAASYLHTLLAKHPTNERGRYLLRLIATVHLKKPTGSKSILFYTIPLFNPDRLLGHLDRWIGWIVFSRAFFLAWSVLVVTGAAVLLQNLDRISKGIDQVTQPGFIAANFVIIPALWLIRRFQLFGHEFTHGLCCKHFGGKVPEIGLLIMYGNPGAYCDISSTYLISDRRKRALVSMVGPMWDLMLTAIYTWVWHLTDFDSALSIAMFASIPLSGFTVFTNLHPFLRNDGYLALSDILDHNSLREDAFEYLRIRMRRWLFQKDIPIPPEFERQRRLLLWYAVPSVMFTFLFTFLTGFILTRALILTFQLPGLIAAVVLIPYLFREMIKRLVMNVWSNRGPLLQSKVFRVALLLLLAAVLVVITLPVERSIRAPGGLQPVVTPVRSVDDGVLSTVLVKPGDEVVAGQRLAQLSDGAAALAVEMASARLEEMEGNLFQLLQGTREEELDIARAQYWSANEVYRDARRRASRLRKLYRQGLVGRSELDGALADEAAALRERSTSYADVIVLQTGASAAELTTVRTEIEARGAELRAARRTLAATVITAPCAGLVRFDIDEDSTQGLAVKSGQVLFSIRSLDEINVDVEVPLNGAIDILEEMPTARIQFSGVPDRIYTGRVSSPNMRIARSVEGIPYVFATVELDDPGGLVRAPAGLRATVHIAGPDVPLFWQGYLAIKRMAEVDVYSMLRDVEQAQIGDADPEANAAGR